jgi:hypothetical protein
MTEKPPEQRWQNGAGYQGQAVYSKIVEYGWDNIMHEVLSSGLDWIEAHNLEKELIIKHKDHCYNEAYVKPSPMKGKKPNYEYPKTMWTISGETKSIDDWCKFYNVPRCRVHKNMNKYGFTPMQALTFPPIPKYGGWNLDPIGYYKSLGLLDEDWEMPA